jgi:phosphoglucosamine mutase
MQKRFFGTDGIRGTVGEYPITPDFMLKLGWATGRVFAQGSGNRQVIIGKDTRISGYMFESALEAGLAAAGVNTQLLGPMPTPAVAYLTRTFRAQAGIVISASHNPYPDNGIKFFSAEGLKLPDDVELEIERHIDEPMTTVSSARLGKAVRIVDAAGRYIEFCKGSVPAGMNLNGLKIVVDCAHGSTYHIAPPVLTELGANVVTLGDKPNGLNINDGVGATKPDKLRELVLAEGADLGMALDGDGDRLIMVDHRGEIVDGDELLFIIARSRLDQGLLRGPVIGTLMSNLGLEHALSGLDIDFKRAAVGDRYVLELMEEFDGLLGGEGSGHIICRDRTTTGDGIISGLQVLAEMKTKGRTLHELKQGMEKYPQCLVNVRIRERADLARNDRIRQAQRAVEQRLQGMGRVLLRSSGTEPLVRVMVEGRDASLVEQLANQLANDVRDVLAA